MPRKKLGKYSRRTPLAARYRAMVSRCYDPLNKSFPSYGGKGVTVCQEWLDSYDAFVDWAESNNYAEGMELDKDILSHRLGIFPPRYSPQTCMFVTSKTNVHNSSSLKFTEETVTKILKDFEDSPDTFHNRQQICRKYSITSSQLGGILSRRAGKKLGRGKTGVLTPILKQEIISLRSEGFPFKVVADRLGISYNTCKAWHAKYKRGEDPECLPQ